MPREIPNLLRPETADDSAVEMGDYPVPLLTRRRFASFAADISERRASAPGLVKSMGSRRPPC